jgi:hypothetical protein
MSALPKSADLKKPICAAVNMCIIVFDASGPGLSPVSPGSNDPWDLWLFPEKVDTVKRKVSIFGFHIQREQDTQSLSAFFLDYRMLRYTQTANVVYPDGPDIFHDKPTLF